MIPARFNHTVLLMSCVSLSALALYFLVPYEGLRSLVEPIVAISGVLFCVLVFVEVIVFREGLMRCWLLLFLIFPVVSAYVYLVVTRYMLRRIKK